MKVSQDVVLKLASQHSLPPSLVWGVAMMAEGDEKELPRLVAMLRDLYDRHRLIEPALSALFSGDPTIHQNPLHPAAGRVNAVLGIAAARPTWGLPGWKPAQPEVMQRVVRSMEKVAGRLARLGGVVGPEHVQAWGQVMERLRRDPDTPTAEELRPPPRPLPPPPDVHRASEVAEFAAKLKKIGMTPEHFVQIFPAVAQIRRRLLGPHTVKVEHVAPHVGQTPDQVLASIRSQPYERYPEHSVGTMYDLFHTASLIAPFVVGRNPYPAEVARFASAGYGHREVAEYYERLRDAEDRRGEMAGPGRAKFKVYSPEQPEAA